MGEAFDERVFAVGNDEYSWPDVVQAAKAWGDWAALEADVRHVLACVDHLRATGEEPGEDELDEAASEFRYDRDLVSAEEMEAWLEARNLTVDEWMEYILGAVSVRRCAGLEPPIVPGAAVKEEDVERHLTIEAVCSGACDDWARRLAGRAAAAAAIGDEGGDAERLERLDAAFQVYRQRVLTPQVLRDQLSVRHLDWIRIHGLKVVFPSEPMAREAALCMKEDHLSLEEVAADAGQVVHEVAATIDELAPEHRDRFLAARPRDVVGPLPVDTAFELCLVKEKILPSIEDDDIRARAEDAVLQRLLKREVAERVRWMGRFA